MRHAFECKKFGTGLEIFYGIWSCIRYDLLILYY